MIRKEGSEVGEVFLQGGLKGWGGFFTGGSKETIVNSRLHPQLVRLFGSPNLYEKSLLEE